MGSIESITSSVQAVYTGLAAKKVLASSGSASTRDVGGQKDDRSPPGSEWIWDQGKGTWIDIYA